MVDYAQLEEEIKRIVELADKQPEKYQVKCFELLVTAILAGSASINVSNTSQETKQKIGSQDFKIP
jgi:hypothetical protein